MKRVALLVALIWPGLSVAADGVLEINQTCAVQTGCFSGDTAGYPITIDGSAGRSYVLTSDLVVPDQSTNGIVVSTPDVGIDLNLFTIIGAACVGETEDCTPASGAGSGIAVTTSNIRGVAVRNGSITGMGSVGVALGPQAEVQNLRVRWNRLNGISSGIGSTISGNTVYSNGARGISGSFGSTVSGNTAYSNGSTGIFVNAGSSVSGNTVFLNGSEGIATGAGSNVSGNTARDNVLGISTGTGSVVSNNAISESGGAGLLAADNSVIRGNSVDNSGGDGIDCSPDCTVIGNRSVNNTGIGILADGGVVENNTARLNGGVGIQANSSVVRGNLSSNNTGAGLDGNGNTGYVENVLNSNGGGEVIGSPNEIGSNVCGGDTTCP